MQKEPHKVKQMLKQPQVVAKAGAKEAPKEAGSLQAEAVEAKEVVQEAPVKALEVVKALERVEAEKEKGLAKVMVTSQY